MIVELALAERLANELARLKPEHAMRLAGIGWLQMKRYRVYRGPGAIEATPDRYRLIFVAAPEVLHTIEPARVGLPSEPPADVDERTRFLTWLHDDDPFFNLSEEDPPIQVHHEPWSDAIAFAAGQDLVRLGHAEIPLVGRFEIERRPGKYPIVKFAQADAMDVRLEARDPR